MRLAWTLLERLSRHPGWISAPTHFLALACILEARKRLKIATSLARYTADFGPLLKHDVFLSLQHILSSVSSPLMRANGLAQ